MGIAVVCGAPALALVEGVTDPGRATWSTGVVFTLVAVAQLFVAARAASAERRHGAEVLQLGSRGFGLAR